MFLSLCDEVTNVLCVSLLSHDRYQYDCLILSKQTWAYPRQHLQQLLWCVISVRLNLPEVEERKLCLWYTPTRRNQKELSLDLLEANISVPCSHLLIGQSNVVVDFYPGNVETHCASATVLTSRKNAWEKISISPLRYYANCVSTTLTVLILRNVESVYFFYSNPVHWRFTKPSSSGRTLKKWFFRTNPKTDLASSYEMFVTAYQTRRCHIPQNLNRHTNVEIRVTVGDYVVGATQKATLFCLRCFWAQQLLWGCLVGYRLSRDNAAVLRDTIKWTSAVKSLLSLKNSGTLHWNRHAHPASYTMGPGSFPGVKRPARGVDHPLPI
jgi:hypothetical protein